MQPWNFSRSSRGRQRICFLEPQARSLQNPAAEESPDGRRGRGGKHPSVYARVRGKETSAPRRLGDIRSLSRTFSSRQTDRLR
jgi:hypothetical protein